jgi:K+/H+ antiporter YhaU regulatory subunit KhtT
MSREIQETELPGIGRRFDLAGIDGTVSVVIHHSGRRDMYVREARPRDEPTTLALTDHQARQLGAILAGAYFALRPSRRWRPSSATSSPGSSSTHPTTSC